MTGRSAEGGILLILLVGPLHSTQIPFATGGADGPIRVSFKCLDRRFETYQVCMQGSYPGSTHKRTARHRPDHTGPAQSSRWMSPKMCRGEHRAGLHRPLREGTYTAAPDGADPASTMLRGASFAPLPWRGRRQ